MRRGTIAMVLAVVMAACHATTSPRPEVAAGGGVKLVRVAALADPVGFTFTPNGRIVYLERDTGRVRLLNPRTGNDRILYRFTGVDAEGERGALGVALHPDNTLWWFWTIPDELAGQYGDEPTTVPTG